MSLILDALNRSREDTSGVPGLATRHESVTEQQPDHRIRLLVSALVTALLLLAWLLWDRSQVGQGEPPVQPASSPQQQPLAQQQNYANVPASSPTVAPEPRPAATAALTQPPTIAEASRAERVPLTPEPAIDQALVETASTARDNNAVDPDIDALYQPGAASTTAPVPAQGSAIAEEDAADASAEEVSVDIERLLRQAESDLEDARLAEHPAPFISDLSQQVKDGIPTIYYQRHEYSGLAGQSRVLLNGKRLGKGGSPVSGMQVEDILPDSVVLRYGDTQFRLRALNSWVNL